MTKKGHDEKRMMIKKGIKIKMIRIKIKKGMK